MAHIIKSYYLLSVSSSFNSKWSDLAVRSLCGCFVWECWHSTHRAPFNVSTETLSLLLVLYGLSILSHSSSDLNSLSHLSALCIVRQCWKSCFDLAPRVVTQRDEGVAFFCFTALTCCWQLRCSARHYAKLNIKEAEFRRIKDNLWIGAKISQIIQQSLSDKTSMICVLEFKQTLLHESRVCRLSINKIIWTR